MPNLEEISACGINNNFTALKNELATKANLNGGPSETFEVADATQSTEAVNKGQLDSAVSNINADIAELEDELEHLTLNTKFCMNSGNTTDGKADLLSFSGMVISTKTGGGYSNAIGTNIEGTQITLSSAQTLDMTGYSNSTYNLFVKTDGTLEAFATNLYKQAKTPSSPVVNDVWLNTSQEPLTAKKYDGSVWVDYTGIPIGKVILASGAITTIEAFAFNQNGFDVNFQTQGYRFPDYTNKVSKAKNTLHQAECDGYILMLCSSVGEFVLHAGETSSLDFGVILAFTITGNDLNPNISTPIQKGWYYKEVVNHANMSMYFVPAKGVN